MPTQSDVLLMESYSSASQKRGGGEIISESFLSEPSSPVMMFPVNVPQRPEVRKENNNYRERVVYRIQTRACSSLSVQAGRAGPPAEQTPTPAFSG